MIATRAYFVSMSCLPAKKRLTSELLRSNASLRLIEISLGAFVHLEPRECLTPDSLKHPTPFYT
ncbi:hypothetical protein BIZ41_08295 [Escherichia coli]|nr:hypothetical protein BIZ41_08295 [Escherichia coli]